MTYGVKWMIKKVKKKDYVVKLKQNENVKGRTFSCKKNVIDSLKVGGCYDNKIIASIEYVRNFRGDITEYVLLDSKGSVIAVIMDK